MLFSRIYWNLPYAITANRLIKSITSCAALPSLQSR